MSKKNGKVNLQLTVETEVRDKDGKLLSTHRQVSKSLLKNFAQFLVGLMYGNISNKSQSIKDTGNVARSMPDALTTTSYIFWAGALVTVDTHGIQVGSGSTAVTRDDYVLATKMGNGNGAGQMAYGATTVESPDGTPPATTFRVVRTFTNNYGSTQTVYEIGLVIDSYSATGGADRFFLVARDVLTSPQAVPTGATLTTRYIFSITA